MWSIVPLEPYEARRRKWPKKYKRELLAVHNNLDTFFTALVNGQRPADARFGFIHPEPMGVLAIDQKGGGASMKETRLYVYPDTRTESLYLITLGDKDSQSADIDQCSEFIKEVRCQEASKSDPSPRREPTHAQE